MQEWLQHAAAHPRPDRVRPRTTRLDGAWRFGQGSPGSHVPPHNLPRKIRVPFCVESELSGIGESAPRVVWYRTKFHWPEQPSPERRALLTFGASDYKTRVWLNGRSPGEHEGGYTPFTFDTTPQLRKGENELLVRVSDTPDPRIPRGKQSIIGRPFSIFYTPVTGIWQSVYLEAVGRAHVRDLRLHADRATGDVHAALALAGLPGDYRIELRATGPGGKQVEHVTTCSAGPAEHTVDARFNMPAPKAWSTDAPNLYQLEITLRHNGAVCDTLSTYFAFRDITIEQGRILLNGDPLYHQFMLKQGYFARGHYTPADWSDFRRDVEMVRALGFNGVRMHQKIENPAFLFWCDALGLLVWEEMPSGFLWSATLRSALRRQWAEAVRRDRNHPCIIAWVPFCESWGVNNLIWSPKARDFVREIVALTRRLDPTRPVVDNSGFEHVETDILDIHQYLGKVERTRAFYKRLKDPAAMRFHPANVFHRFNVSRHTVSLLAPTIDYTGQPLVVSEYGGFGFYKTSDRPLMDNFRDYTLAIAEQDHLQGYCYTQMYDTELERNGLLTLDREPKVPVHEVAEVNRRAREMIS